MLANGQLDSSEPEAVTDDAPLVELRGIRRTFEPDVVALDAIDLTLRHGESVAIVGTSGSGKSTLLNILGLLDSPTTGEHWWEGTRVDSENDRARAGRRARDLGFVFQRAHLLGALSAFDNVMMGPLYAGIDLKAAKALSTEALGAVGLADRKHAVAATLSGGEMQRAAIARALARPAKLWLADEPTGNLDSARSRETIELLKQAARTRNACLVVVTHEPEVAEQMSRVITISDGRIVSDVHNNAVETPAQVGQGVPADEPPPVDTAEPFKGGRRTPRFIAQAIAAYPRRAWSGITAAALAVALTLIALGLAQSAAAQVTSLFDAQRASQVTARVTIPADNPPRWSLAVEDLRKYPGVKAVEYWQKYEQVPLSNGNVSSLAAELVISDVLPGPSTASVIKWAANHKAALATGEVILGKTLANRLGVAQLDLQPEITVGTTPMRVVGIMSESRDASAIGAAFTAVSPGDLPAAKAATIHVVTASGAARGIADRLVSIVDPYRQTSTMIDPVLTADAFRGRLESGVSSSLYLLAGLAGLAGLVAVVFVNVLGVGARTAEFGVRRAFGARRRELVALVVGETTVLGVIGAVLGLALGFITIMVVTAIARWQPVFDLKLLAIPVIGALLLGTLGGIAPAVIAGRVHPADAVRA